MKQSLYYTKMKFFHGETLTGEYYVYLKLIQNIFLNQCNLIGLQHEECFMVFTNSNAVITGTQIFDSLGNFLSEKFIYDELEANEIIEKVLSMNDYKMLIPVSGVLITYMNNKYDDYITIIARQQNDNVIVGTLLSKSRIFELFNLHNLPEDTFFYIKDKNNNIIISNNIDNSLIDKINAETVSSAAGFGDISGITHNGVIYNTLRQTMRALECDVVIGIPDSYFTNLLFPLRVLCSLYIIAAIIIGILLSMVFAKYNYAPLKNLVNIPLLLDFKKNKTYVNEYQYLKNVMQYSDDEIAKLRNKITNMNDTLRINLFMRLLYGSVSKEEELNLLSQLIPQLESEYRIIIIKLDVFDDACDIEYLSFLVNEQLTQLSDSLSSGLVLGQLERTKSVALMPESSQNNRLFSEMVKQVNNNIRVYNAQITAGVSEVFIGTERISTAFYHAQYSLSEAVEDINYYTGSTEIESSYIDFTGLQRLYELVRSGKREAINDMLEEAAFMLMNGKTYSCEDVKKAFYTICFVLESITRDMQCKTVILPEFNENSTIQELFISLQEAANRIVSELEEEREQKADTEMKKAFFAYLENNLTSKALYASSIADALGISESYVYKLARECTGESLNDYIKRLRAKKAAHLLKTTDLLVADISEACGFDVMNTFYRVFKKFYGVTPSEYRG